MNKKFWYLKSCDLFEQLTSEQIEQVKAQSKSREFSKNSLIYLPSDRSDSVLLLTSGRVKIYHITAEGKQAVLAFSTPAIWRYWNLVSVRSSPRPNRRAADCSDKHNSGREKLFCLLKCKPSHRFTSGERRSLGIQVSVLLRGESSSMMARHINGNDKYRLRQRG